MSAPRVAPLREQQGVFVIEFALVAVLFFTLLFGIIEFGRLLWTWNAAGEATRLGARMAIVCDQGDDSIVQRMRERLPYLANSDVSIAYEPNGCSTATCTNVTVSLTGYVHRPIIPFLDLSVTIPPFRTTLPREYMSSAGNPVCN